MSSAATPPREAPHGSRHATWLPRDIPYNEVYENNVQKAIMYPPSKDNAITIIPDTSPEEPQSGVSVRARDIDPASLPLITFEDLPISLADPRRIYASPLPGIKLTHPGGYLEGGPGFAPNDDVFASDFISRFNITNPDQLRDAVQNHIHQYRESARERMNAREEATQHNARIEKEIKTLMDQREMEVKIETRMKDEAKAKRERRERRNNPRAGS